MSAVVQDAPPAVAMSAQYSARTLPVHGYIASKHPPFCDIVRIDRGCLCRMLRCPGFLLPHQGISLLAADWGFPRLADAEVFCLTELAMNAMKTEAKWRPCALCLVSERPLTRWAARYDDRQVGLPIAVSLADALRPPRIAAPAARVVKTLSPRWVADAVRSRMVRVLLGDGSEPELPAGALQLERLRDHARRLSPQWAVTFMRGSLNLWCTWLRMHDGTRGSRLFGCEGQRDCLSHSLHCVCRFG